MTRSRIKAPRDDGSGSTADERMPEIIQLPAASPTPTEQQNVHAWTNPESDGWGAEPERLKTRDDLAEELRQEADRVDGLARDHEEDIDNQSRLLMRGMVEFVEMFEVDGTVDHSALTDWLDGNGGKAHGNSANFWLRVPKAFSTADTPRELKSRRGKVMWAIMERGIRSGDLLTAFEAKEVVGTKRQRMSGMAKFVAIYDAEHKRSGGPEPAEIEAQEDDENDDVDTEEVSAAKIEQLVAGDRVQIIFEGRLLVAERIERRGELLVIVAGEAEALKHEGREPMAEAA